MGWTNETVVEPQHKPALTNQEVSDVIAEAMLDREVEFADAFAWLVDTGMRHETEFRKFTIDNIDFKKMTICFFREKTQEWSQHINLTLRCQEIAKRYRPIAMKREDRRMFPNMTKSKVRTLFARYGKRLSLKNFTPYCTKHTFITNLSLKVSPKIISAIAGIAVETALTYYNQVKPSEIKKAMATLNDDSSVVSMMGHNRKVEKIK